MRIIFLFAILLPAIVSRAQSPSRLVFFRIDDDGRTKTSYKNWMQRTSSLMQDESRIADMSAISLLVYTEINTGGKLSFAPAADGDSVSNVLTTRKLNGGIAFIKISPESPGSGRTTLQAVSYANFQNYYKEQLWMIKALNKLGYGSPGKLAEGFEILPLAQVLPRKPLLSLTDTAFYDRGGKKTVRANASWQRVATRDEGGRLMVTEYYLPENRIKSRGMFTTLDSESREGPFIAYFRSGAIESKGAHHANKVEGPWEFFRDSSISRHWYTVEYRDGKHDGMLTSYYPDGRLKRKELRKVFYDTVREYDADPQPRIDSKDSLISGICYDTGGREIPFTPFHIMPKAEFGMNDFLIETLRYPREARVRGIEGRVVVKFTIAANGEVEDAEVVRRASQHLDAEALRVVRAMPRWTPGRIDDEKVAVSFTLPVSFKLD